MSREEDQELQRFLDRDHPIRDAYGRLPKDEPPAALDAAILGAAREEARRPVRPRWLIPMSVAATVILGVGLSTRQLSAPMESVSDVSSEVSYENSTLDMQRETQPGAVPGAVMEIESSPPVPRPNVESLIQPAPIEDTNVRRAKVDVDQMREQALAQTRTFTPPKLEAPKVQASRADRFEEAEQDFATPPPATRDRAGAREMASNRANAVDELRNHVIASRTIVVETERLEATMAKKQAREDKIEWPEAGFSNPQAAAAPAVEPTLMQSFAGDAPARERQLKDHATANQLAGDVIRDIQILHEDGREKEAKALFDELIRIYPQVELPDDFPFERSLPTS